MGKVAKILPEEFKVKAIENGIPLPTVYRRIKSGWSLSDATNRATVISSFVRKCKRNNGEFSSDTPRRIPITFYFYDDEIDRLEDVIARSDLTRSEFIAKVLLDHINHS